MTWKSYHDRGAVLRDVITAVDARRDGLLPMDVTGVTEAFGDELTLLGALQLRWHTRLAGRIEPAATPTEARRATARDLPGVRAVIDHSPSTRWTSRWPARPPSRPARSALCCWRGWTGVGHTGRMTDVGADGLRAGQLLVATPLLIDPNFAETVVLLLDADENGALGVVLNRPSTVPVGDVLEPWAAVVAEPEVLFQGGPVPPRERWPSAGSARWTTPRSASGRSPATSASSTSTPPSSWSTAAWTGCGSTPGTPVGAPASSRARSRRAAGTSCRRCRLDCLPRRHRRPVARRAPPAARRARLALHPAPRPRPELKSPSRASARTVPSRASARR